jgi:uncharacterized protein
VSDPRALVRVVDEFLWVLRRAGFTIATAQAVDAARVVSLLGWESKSALRDGFAACLVTDHAQRSRFEAEFDRFFSAKRDVRRLRDRLLGKGFAEHEVLALEELLRAVAAAQGDAELAPLGALLERGPDLDRLLSLAGTAAELRAMQAPGQVGFFTHKLLSRMGLPAAHGQLGVLRSKLADAIGASRADLLIAALKTELERAGDEVRRFVRSGFELAEDARSRARAEGDPLALPLPELDADQSRRVRLAVQRFLARLAGKNRVRSRLARLGRIDVHATMRRARRTNFVPAHIARKEKKRPKPELFVLCDISESVRAYSAFLLEFAHMAQALTERTRSFVFVSDVAEVTEMFRALPAPLALSRAYSGALVSVVGNTNLGRVLATFRRDFGRKLTHRSTVVILSDGRTNYLADGADDLRYLSRRARAVYWLTPEASEQAGGADSALARYAKTGAQVVGVSSAGALLRVARRVLT